MLLIQHSTVVKQQAEFMEFDGKLIDREPGCKLKRACFVKQLMACTKTRNTGTPEHPTAELLEAWLALTIG